MATLAEHMNRDFVAVDKCTRELPGLLTKNMSFLWAVDSIEANTFSLSVVEYVDGVIFWGKVTGRF